MKQKSYYNFFMNFSNRLRFNIIMLLKQKPLSVKEIVEKLGEEQSKISHNLRKMETCHVLYAKRKGKQRIYYLNKETVLPMLKMVEKHVKKHCPKKCNQNVVETKKQRTIKKAVISKK